MEQLEGWISDDFINFNHYLAASVYANCFQWMIKEPVEINTHRDIKKMPWGEYPTELYWISIAGWDANTVFHCLDSSILTLDLIIVTEDFEALGMAYSMTDALAAKNEMMKMKEEMYGTL